MDKNSYLVISFLTDSKTNDRIVESDQFPQSQTINFNTNLMKSLEQSKDNEYTYVSSYPISIFPYSKFKKVPKGKEIIRFEDKKIANNYIPFFNLKYLRIISKTISTIYYSFKYYSNKKNKKGVIVYSVHIPYLIAGLFISKIFKIPLIGIWTDPPGVKTDRDNILQKNIRKLEYKICKKIMNNFDKAIVITKQFGEKFLPEKKYLVVEAISDKKQYDENSITNFINKSNINKKIKIVYTGTLDKKYGIDRLVQAFYETKNNNVELHLYGKGDYEENIKQALKETKNIKYGGHLTKDKILDVQKNADYLINVRDPSEEFVKYSFPSKILEYMTSGTPVITTMLPGMPQDYAQHLIILKNNSVKTILNEINHLDNSYEKHLIIAKNAQQFSEKKHYKNQGILINNYLKENISDDQ